MKARIVKRTHVDERISYVIQQRHFLFRWWWVDAWVNRGPECNDSFSTLKEAEQNLCYWDGSVTIDEIIELNK